MEIIRGVEAVTEPAGSTGAVAVGRRAPSVRDWLDAVLARRPLGVLFVLCSPTKAQQERLRRQDIPFVVVDTDSATTASVPTVGSNNWNGGLLATRHLLELGHRRIGIISGPKDVLCSRARLAGFRAAHEEADVEIDQDLVRYGTFYLDAGYNTAWRCWIALTGRRPCSQAPTCRPWACCGRRGSSGSTYRAGCR